MNNLKYIGALFALLIIVILPAQAQDKILTSVGKTGQTYLELVSTDSMLIYATDGGTQSVEIRTNTVVDITTTETWCKTELSGETISITAEANTGAATREAVVKINGLDGNSITLTVNQLGTDPAFIIREKSVNVNGQSCRVLLNILTNTELDFALPAWITVIDATTSIGLKTYIFATGNLDTQGSRTDNITVSAKADAANAKQIAVTQTFEGYPRFIVMSDVHFGGGDATTRVTRSLENLYSQDPDIDALIVNGDLTNNGYQSQYDEFRSVFEDTEIIPEYVQRYYIMGNHEWFAGTNSLDNYLSLGHDHDKYFEIKGYPFIYVGMSGSGEQDYSEKSYEFLRQSLKDASERYAGKPIFVFTHIPIYGTTHGSGDTDGGWGNKTFYSIFKDYPQIIHFCGHTHFSLRDPKALWQKEFTSIDDGANYYCYLNPGIDEDGSTPSEAYDVQEAVIVAVENSDNVNIRRIDCRRNEEIEPAWNFNAPYDGSNMAYASYSGGEAPYFENGEITTEEGQTDERKITFTQATDDDIVLYYNVAVKNSDGTTVKSANRCSSFYLGSEMPETRSITLTGLPDGSNMYAEVKAYDPYGNVSEPLVSAPFTVGTYTPAEGTVAPDPDLLDFVINDSGEPVDATQTFVLTKGSKEPLPYYDNTYQRNAVQFQGNSNQYYKAEYTADGKVATALKNEFTLEALFRCNSYSSCNCVLSSQDSGGTGIELDNGRIIFYAYIDGEYKSAKSNVYVSPGYFYHVVATYDKSTLKLYINGFPAGVSDVSGDLALPATSAAYWFCIGGDASKRSDCDFPLDGQVIVARIYSKAVSRDEVYCMFKTYDDIANSGSGEDEDPVDVAPEADLMDIEFGENGTAKDVSPVATEVTAGEVVPETYYNETYKRWAAKFTASSNKEFFAVPYGTSGLIHEAMSGSFSLEVLAIVNNAGSNLPAIVSSQQSGGFGIEPGSDVQVWGCFNNQYATVYTGVNIEKDRYYHIIAVYDSENGEMRAYVDGVKAGNVSVSGMLDYPQGNAQYFCIGGDASYSGTTAEYQMIGEVALVRMYSHALSLGEAKKLYNDLQATAAGE